MNFNTGAVGQSPLLQGSKPSDTNLLMAAADMNASGEFKPKSPMPNERPRLTGNKPRKLKVVK